MGEPSPETVTHTEAVLAQVKGIVTIALILACAGAAVPYGTATGPQVGDLTWLEWTLSVLAGIAMLGLIADLFYPWGLAHDAPGARWGTRLRRSGVAFLLAGLMWAVLTAYVMLLPSTDITFAWRIGHALPSLGWAFLALTTWRYTVVVFTGWRGASAVDRQIA
jgi:hypothetical protein